jgi:hypothetical protein
VNRREFITLLGSAAATWPIAARAQQRRYLVGHLAIAAPTDTPPPPPANWKAFVQGLREAGYMEGVIVVARTDDHPSAASSRSRVTDVSLADSVRVTASSAWFSSLMNFSVDNDLPCRNRKSPSR